MRGVNAPPIQKICGAAETGVRGASHHHFTFVSRRQRNMRAAAPLRLSNIRPRKVHRRMKTAVTARAEAPLATRYSLVACLGFVTDFCLLKLAGHMGLEPAWARVVSLTCAMQLTFWINGLFVFRCLTRKSWGGAWLGYMVTNGFGNFCNYWAFVTLVSLHNPILSNHLLDLVVGGLIAWMINYTCARYLIFGVSRDGKGCAPLGEVLQGIGERVASLTGKTPRRAEGTVPPLER
jgi:putative flippase GtrA